MVDISHALAAKSDQLNAMDIMGAEPIIRIREVKDTKAPQQPVWIYFDGDNGKPWKPSKGMLRILGAGWGFESDAWLGRHVQIFCEPTVKYAGEEVGGVQIRAMSDIKQAGLNAVLAISKTKRTPFKVAFLKVDAVPYPAEKFAKALPAMAAKMEDGSMTLHQVIAQCQKTGALSAEQLQQLEQSAPVHIEYEQQTPDQSDEVM